MAALVPDEVMEAVTGLDERLQRLEDHIRKLLLSWSPAAVALLSPVERASAYMAVSRALNAVYCVFLRSRGESPDDHPVKSELERVKLYTEKVLYACDRNKAPRPSLNLDIRAANRFIEHAIPDLTDEQKQLVREAGKKKSRPSIDPLAKSSKKQKSETVAEAAAAFLAEACSQQATMAEPGPEENER